MTRAFAGLILLASIAGLSQAQQQSSIAQGNVTWHFASECETGRFANGDWWVLAPVVITRIEPDYSDGFNGWEIDPVPNAAAQGFDKELTDYAGGKVPALPCTLKAGMHSIVKAVSSAAGVSRRIASAKVLTVVSEIPPSKGAAVFRPPYVGTKKPYYYVDSIKWPLLPSYAPVGNPPSLTKVEADFANTNLAHTTTVRYMRPVDAVPDDYQPGNCPSISEALLRLMLNDGPNAKKAAMIKVLQRGIDKIYWQIAGNVQPSSGHMPGLIALPAFTAALLDITEYKTLLGTEGTNFEEYQYIKQSDRDSTLVLWGQNKSEAEYWDYIASESGNRSNRDPYHYIDGGPCGQRYQTITFNGHKGQTLTAILMPSIGSIYESGLYRRMVTYVDRMAAAGVWAQPDPCAPYPYELFSGNTQGRGVTWGEDPKNPGRCILDPDLEYYKSPTDFACKQGAKCGRFPDQHGSKSGWQYTSAFVDAMWNAYRKQVTALTGPPEPARADGLQLTIINNPLRLDLRNMVFTFTPEDGRKARACIMALSGKTIKSFHPTHEHQIIWKGSDNRGKLVGPGVYYFLLETGSRRGAALLMVLGR